MTTAVLRCSAFIVCLAIAVNGRSYSYEVEPSEYDNALLESFDDSLEAEKRELEAFEAEKRELEEFEAQKREVEEFEAEKRKLEELEMEERFLFGCDDVYQCPNGKAKRQNTSYRARPNGCGPEGLNIDRFLKTNCPGLIECCNDHDECYGRYGASRQRCDSAFQSCNARAPRADCRSKGNLMAGAVGFFGCGAFNKAQQSATICY